MSTKSKTVKAQAMVPVPKVVQSEEEEQEEETEEVTENITPVGETNENRKRTAQIYYDKLVIVNDKIVAAEKTTHEGVKGVLIFITDDEHKSIKDCIEKFENSGPKAKSDDSDRLPSYRTINLSAKKYEKDLEFIKAYMTTKEYTAVFLPAANGNLLLKTEHKDGVERTVGTGEISKGWALDTKLYSDAKKYPELHQMLQEKTDADNVPIKKARNEWAVKNHGANRLGGEIVMYSKSDKSEYKIWSDKDAAWGKPRKQLIPTLAKAKPKKGSN